MYQRLLFLLLLFISGAATAQNVMTPSDGDYIYDSTAVPGSLTNPIPAGAGVMQKWVRDTLQKANGVPLTNTRITWDQTQFKCYRWGITSFRLRFPNNYNPALKYPMVVFMHGQGEAADLSNKSNTSEINRENQDQLYWGARLFEQRINAGEWNGFLLFPQIMIDSNQSGGIWNDANIPPINGILDTLEKYNGLDPDRVVTTGLSAGGFGAVNYARLFPQRIAGAVSSSPRFIEDVIAHIPDLVHIPVWIASGGTDLFPSPSVTMNARDNFATQGANLYMSYYPTKDHNTWETQWAQKDVYNRLILTSYWNLHKAQPLLYFQNNQFCNGLPISAKMGLTPGFFAYEWQYNSGGGFATIPGATANIYIATQAGTYRARFKRLAASNWSDWSPLPILISVKNCSTADTAFIENFEKPKVDVYSVFGGGGTTSAYNYQNFDCQNGVFANNTESFSQDATGRQGGKFLIHNTTSACTYHAGDQVWRPMNGATVTPNTDYTLNFYIGNESNIGTNPVSPLATVSATINDAPLSPINVQAVLAGNISWKKYSFIWNSGANTTAQPAILNSSTSSTGNSFVIDEISLVKYKPLPMPGAALKNVQLWSKGGSIMGYEGSPVAVWPNNDINGNALVQTLSTSQPFYKNNGSDNINFNPVISTDPGTNKFMFVPGGFAGSASHNSVYAYMVIKSASISQNAVLLREGPSGTGNKLVMAQTTGSVMKWAGGEDSATIIATPSGAIDLKPTVWTFSKNTIATPSGNKSDIRKNGVVLASSGTALPFTGSASENFYISAFKLNASVYLGSFGGNIAEVIYVLDSNLTTARQSNIESYLAIKYGTTLGTTTTPVSYTASDSSTFWAGNASFQNDVFGIGTDSASGLVLTRSNSVNSGSGDGAGQALKGNLVLSTSTSLPDKHFLMIGNDGVNLNQTVIPDGAALPVAVGSTRINRAWKVANTGSVGAVDISFDTTGLGNQTGGAIVNNYALLIDNDGDGNFNNNTLSFFNATSASGKKINFSGVTLNNGVVFTILTFKAAAALPAVWLGFTAEAVNENALLNWTTSDEMNVDRYVVEHSFNGVGFTATGSVTANNNTGINKYTFTDIGLAAGVHYYRIRRLDKDGKGEYSETKTVKIPAAGANVQVRPNPVVGSTLALSVTVQQSSKTTIQIMSVEGKVMLQQKINMSTGNNLVNLDIATIPSGIYLVQVQLSDEVVTKKFIRQH
ncbi:MAG TPA: T9SS type A sorting domain-containing protein [Chitinophagaceae bacterium]|nr:T9SS type A sorting domain-containing protein [Chitinophagaceae bacterium]